MSEDHLNDTADVCIVDLSSRSKDRWNKVMAAAVLATGHRLYALFDGPGTPNDATEALLQDIGNVLQPVSYYKPQLDVIPLFELASWSRDRVAKLDAHRLLYDPQFSHEAKALLQKLNHVREADNLDPLTLNPLVDILPAHEPPEEKVAAADDRPLSFGHVAVGGTFDRLHVGHRLLLATAALVSTEYVYIGVTGDQLLQNKVHKELLESYETRARAAVEYVNAVRPGLNVQTGALLDPKEPTAAAKDDRMQALVVSKETIPGAEEINKYRRNVGYPELHIVVVDLIVDTQAVQGGKVSSTALREQEAARLRERIIV